MAKVEIYTKKPFCPYCSRAKALLDEQGRRSSRNMTSPWAAPSGPRCASAPMAAITVPQIFIDDQHIGGCDDMFALDRAGKLDALLEA